MVKLDDRLLLLQHIFAVRTDTAQQRAVPPQKRCGSSAGCCNVICLLQWPKSPLAFLARLHYDEGNVEGISERSGAIK